MEQEQEHQFAIGQTLLLATINHIANSPTGQSSLAQVNAIVNGLRQLEPLKADLPTVKATPEDFGGNGKAQETQPEA